MSNDRLAGAPSITAIWLVLGLSVAVFGPIPVPGIGAVNLSLFDVAVPALVLWGALTGWLATPSRTLVIGCGSLILIIALHSVLLGLFGGVPNPLALVKDSLKLIAMVVLFGLLCTLLSERPYRTPSMPSVASAFLALLLAIGVLAPTESYQDFHAQLGATATGLGILWILSLYRGMCIPRMVVLIPALCFAAALWLASKTFTVIALALIGACLLDGFKGIQQLRSTAGKAVIAALLFAVAFGSFEFLRESVSSAPIQGAPHAAVETIVPGVALTSPESSSARRLDLWRAGLTAGLERFPVGIGLGQFNAVVASGMSDSYLRSTSPHNTALTLFIEMGAMGFVVIGAAAVTVWRAIAGFPPAIAVMVFLLLGPSAVLHDVQGMRILLLMVALGLARTVDASLPGVAMADSRKSPS